MHSCEAAMRNGEENEQQDEALLAWLVLVSAHR